jgi:site-specific DNA recombinase
MISRTCPECGQLFYGRTDKKFCDDHCRNLYNNKLNSDSTKYIRNVNNTLRKNWRILAELFSPDKTKVTLQKLMGLQTKRERPEIAFKRFMRCSVCNQPMRGYIAKDYDMPYYKCNTLGCKCNRNANKVNSRFEILLKGFQINTAYMPLLKEQLLLTFQEHNQSLQESNEAITKQIAAIKPQIERLEERFVLEEINSDLYQKYKAKFEEQIEELAKQMTENEMEMSKLEDYITFSLSNCTNLSKMWDSGDYYQRQELQNALFTEGIVYDRQKDDCRSTSDNEFLDETARISTHSGCLINDNSYILPHASARSH